MNTLRIKTLLLGMLMCLSAVTAWAAEGGDDFKLEEADTLNYPVKSRLSVLTLMMKHGNITLLTWDKSEVQLESKITVVAKDRKTAEKTLEARRVKVRHKENKHDVVGEEWSDFTFECPTVTVDGEVVKKAEVEWTVYIPKGSKPYAYAINITCHFGSVDIPEHLLVNAFCVNIMHGSMNVNKFTPKHRAPITLQHCNMNIGSCEGKLDLNLLHSNLNIGNVESVDAESAHTNLNIGDVKTMKCNAAHSNIRIGKLGKNELDLAHSNLEVQNVEEEVVLKSCVHSQIVLRSLVKGLAADHCSHSTIISTLTNPKAFAGYSVDGAFARLQLIVPETFSARCDISNVHGSVKTDVSNKMGKYTKGHSENGFRSSYVGVIGTSPDAKPMIKITNRHGDIHIKEDYSF